MVTLTWLLVITVLAAALAIFDGIRRLRGHHSNSILAIAELVFAVLMLVSVFVALPAPFTLFWFAVALLIVLILILLFRGTGGRGVATITVLAFILTAIVVLIDLGWLAIPGLV